MNPLTTKIRAAQRRLWVNRWLDHLGWTLTIGACGWIVALVSARLCALTWPLGWMALGATAAAVIGSVVWTAIRRETTLDAAVALDRAAGLKERVSSGLVCASSSDPFSQAVVADAAQSAGPISVRRFVPIRGGRSLIYGGAVAVAGLVFLWLFPEFDLLGKAQARDRIKQRLAAANETRTALAQPVEAVKNLVESNPALKDMKEMQELEALTKPQDKPVDPVDLRREAIKKLEKLGDELKKQAASERFKDLQETKNRLKEMGKPQDAKSPPSKLMQALTDGDFKQAQEELSKMKEQLAKKKHDAKSQEEVKKMSEQLDQLAKKLNDAAGDKNLEQQLKQAGLNAEQMKRILDALNKKDPQQLAKMMEDLEKKLKKEGMSQQQIDKMKKQVQQAQKQQGSKEQMNKLAEAMKKAGQKCQSGDKQGAQQQMDQAGEQLSEMEMMEQQMGEIDSKMSQLDDLKDEMGDQSKDEGEKQCKQCNGTGMRKDGSPCPHCDGTGQGNGNKPGNGPPGRGRGAGQRGKKDTDVAFQKKRAKVEQRQGAVIGQWFVKGDQIKGESKAQYLEAVQSAVRDASDALEKDQVPRAYQKAVKNYFDRLGEEKPAASSSDGGNSGGAGGGEKRDKP